ncbi:hypothetical protein E4U17_002009 [Claviceps sp. LM77 group G4]|nr:hypothetical protein E4U17_002009 [Claviceps sp. LM77 group G4]KAG6075077.1 hypothetical protein E4U33_002229 [Claviceps sp. LM78 group G4]
MRVAAPTAHGAIKSRASEVRNDLDASKYCRSYFPRDLIDTAESKSNDTAMNHYSPLTIVAWCADIDATPCTSIRDALDHIAKYCMKADVPTASYTDIAKSILPHLSDSRPVVSLAARLLNKLLTELDWSAQETYRIPTRTGNLRGRGEVSTLNTNRPQPQRLADEVRDRILHYVPRDLSDPEHPTHSDYCRLKYVTWKDAFHHLQDGDPRRLRFDYIDEIPTLEEEINEFEAADLGEDSNNAYFQELLDAGLGEAERTTTGRRERERDREGMATPRGR